MTKKEAQEEARRKNLKSKYISSRTRNPKASALSRNQRSFVVDTGKKGKGILSKLPTKATGTRFDVVTKGLPMSKMKKAKRVKGLAEGGANTLALRSRGLDKGRRDMLNTFKEAKRIKKSGRMTLDDVKAVEKRKRATAGKNASAKMLDKRGLDKTKRATANKNKQVRDKLKITKFMKRGGRAK